MVYAVLITGSLLGLGVGTIVEKLELVSASGTMLGFVFVVALMRGAYEEHTHRVGLEVASTRRAAVSASEWRRKAKALHKEKVAVRGITRSLDKFYIRNKDKEVNGSWIVRELGPLFGTSTMTGPALADSVLRHFQFAPPHWAAARAAFRERGTDLDDWAEVALGHFCVLGILRAETLMTESGRQVVYVPTDRFRFVYLMLTNPSETHKS